jgi:hypothetical protein
MSSRISDMFRPVEPDVASEPQRPPRPTRAEAANALREFRSAQPLEVVALRPSEQSQRNLTLAGALQLLEEYGGSVEPEPHGTLVFRLPRQLVPGSGDRLLRRKLEAACEVLDASRPIVHHLLSTRSPLPNARPALGGGVVG